jgi:serine/threonine protein kinase
VGQSGLKVISKEKSKGKLVQIETSDETEKKLWAKYLFKKIIGKGGFSIVIALFEKSTSKIIAAKVVEKHKTNPKTLNLLKEEPIILKKLYHPHII